MKQRFSFIVAVLLAAAIFLCIPAEVCAAEKGEAVESVMLDKINALREDAGLDALVVDEDLVDIAEIRAKEASVKWSHVRPDGSDPLDLIPLDKWAGENLSYCKQREGRDICDVMFTALCNSPTHLENMMFSEFSNIGIATYERSGVVYVAYMFSS